MSSQADHRTPHCPITSSPTLGLGLPSLPDWCILAVPTSLMKYVLFLSGHLDRPVSSLEQNDSTTAEKGGSVGWREVVLSLFPSICPLGSSVIPRRTRYSDRNMHFGESPFTRLGESRNERPIRRAYLLLFQNTGKIPTNKYPSIRTTIKSSVNKTAFLL